jgi:hypothetical protein
MPAAGVLAPLAILVAAAIICCCLALLGRGAPRVLSGAAGWLAIGAVVAFWALQRGVPADLQAGVGAATLHLRADAVAVVFELMVLTPLALLLSFQRRSAGEAAVAGLAGAAAILTIEADRLLPAAAGFVACLTLVQALPGVGWGREMRWLAPAWPLLLWAAAALEGLDGTSEYGAVPVSALGSPLFGLLALAALLASGMLPWRGWTVELWRRGEAGPLAAALVTPLGFLLLLRAYQLGAGHWPSPWLHLALACLGAAVALAAAARAQAAGTRREYLAESAILTGGLALLALALGSPLGVAASLAALAGAALQAGLAPIVPSGRRPVALLGLAVAAGVPPALLFGGRLLALQAALDTGGVFSFLGLAGTLAWLVGVAGAARAVRLPAAIEGRTWAGHEVGAWTGIGLMLATGVGLAAVVGLLAAPAAAEVIPSQAPIVAGGYLAISTPAGGWSAALLGGPLALGLCLMLVYRRGEPAPALGGTEPAPLFHLPLAGQLEPWRARLAGPGAGGVPTGLPRRLLAAVEQGNPWLWGAITVAALVAVSR